MKIILHYSGRRPGAILSLLWQEVDFDNPTASSGQSNQSFRSMTNSGRITSEAVVTFNRNEWSLMIGSSCRMKTDYTASLGKQEKTEVAFPFVAAQLRHNAPPAVGADLYREQIVEAFVCRVARRSRPLRCTPRYAPTII